MTGGSSPSKVVQITNIAPQATKDQMQNLFGTIGKIDEIRLYPIIRDVSCPVFSRICYIKYLESSCVAVAQHLTNTVFIDRALIVSAVVSGNIPDEYKAIEMTNNGTTVPGLHTPDSNLPPEVVNRIEGIHPNQLVTTSDPKLTEFDLPDYPKLPANYDARKIEEIRRTILVLNVPSDWRLDDLMVHFSTVGEVKYGRMAEKNGEKYVMIEFCEQKSIIEALKLQGTEYLGEILNIYHSTEAIIKPEAKSNEAAQREIEEAMSIVKEAQNMISAVIDPVIGMISSKDNGSGSSSSRRRSRSRSRRRSSRSKSRSKRSRSRSKRSRSRKRSRSKTRSSRRSRSKSRKRSRSKSKRESSTRSKRSKSKSRRSKSRSKRSRSRSKRSSSRSHRSKRSRSKDRRSKRSSRSPKRKSISRSPHKSSSRRRSRSRSRDRKRSRSRDRRTSSRKDARPRRSRSRSKSKPRSHSKSRSSRPKESSSSRRSSSKRHSSRSPTHADKKLKSISEEKVVRDYDAEEKIGLEETFKPPEPIEKSDASPEKSDNMDISNSP